MRWSKLLFFVYHAYTKTLSYFDKSYMLVDIELGQKIVIEWIYV